jgi:putative hydrolase of the HAD superfamily
VVATDLTAGRRAVVFDFYGTLTPVSPAAAWTANAASLAAALGVPAAELVRVLDETFGARITGALGGVSQTLEALADRLGVELTDGQLARASQIRRERQEAMFALRPEALGVIRALRTCGLRIGLVSDCTIELPAAWPRLPLARVVDVPVFSCVEGLRKPDPRLFRTVAAGLGVPPDECLYVGDGGGDELAGAAALGMRAVLLAGPDWRNHRTPGLGPDGARWTGARIGSLTELLA